MPGVDPFKDRDVLPTAVKPLNYDIHLRPNLETFKFDGTVKIKLSVLQKTSEIALNAVELEFKSVELQYGDKKLVPASQSIDTKKETAVFTFSEALTPGSTVFLNIDYVGIHNDKMAGFYRSSYTDNSGAKKHMVVTQFEPTDARKAVPCWDEPGLKATFDVTLTVPKHLVALSNMQDIETKESGALKTVKFATTPLMSTYLLAFVVGDLAHIETHTADKQKTLVRVFAPKGQEEQGKFALDVAARTLVFFTEYFKIPYPLPKMDLVAIPDFAAGAMENWGLVTYRTVYLLFDEKASAAKSKERIAYVVGHELAHQWFGNLVSPGWWSDLWLNEGFATWAGWLATDHLFPEWNVWTQFVNNDLQRGLQLDALLSSHPIEVPVKNPAEIHQIFDAISYSKGASVIRMLASYIKDDFRTGVNNYLEEFKFSNADTVDLWRHLGAASKKPIAELMNSWTRQTGYPVVNVEPKGNKLIVRQERFLSGGKATKEQDEATWFVPLQVISSQNAEPSQHVLKEKEASIDLNLDATSLKPNEFVKLNANQTGFFRTLYPDAMLGNIGEALAQGKLGLSDKIGILADVFALAQSGLCSAVSGLKLLKFYVKEDNYIVWNEIALNLGTLKSLYQDNEVVLKKLKQVSRDLFSPLVEKLGWEFKKEEGHLTQLLRALAIGVAGKADDKKVIEEAKRRFNLFAQGKDDQLHPNIRGAVYSIVLANGSQAEYEQVLKLYRDLKIVDQKLIALSALGFIKDETLLKKTLDFSLGEEVRPQDIIYIVSSVASNPEGRLVAWEYVQQNWQTYYDRYYTGSMSLLARVVSSTTEHFSTEAMEKQVSDFFRSKDLPNISRSIEQSLEKIRANTQFLRRDSENVEHWARV